MNDLYGHRLFQLAKLFFKLGVIGFGGPAAHIAMMEDEVVNRRQWLTRSQFLDVVGATNLIPGPNSTEMAIHVGYIYAGWLGLIVAGVCFILPAVTITGILAWFYVTFGQLPQVEPVFYGIQPAAIAAILAALWRLGKKAVKSWQLSIVAIATAIVLLIGFNEVISLLLGGLLGAIWLGAKAGKKQQSSDTRNHFSFLLLPFNGLTLAAVASQSVPVSLWQLGLFFLKVGSVLFGSGYVLIAFLEGGLVEEYGWLTQQRLLDAIAIGQFTPGPVLSTSTFIGYIIAGLPGAIVATVGIFLPSFFFVAALNPMIPRLRSSRWTSAFLDAVNVGAVALMAVVTLKLAIATFIIEKIEMPRMTSLSAIDWLAVAIAIAAAIAAIRWRVNAAWLILGGALAGLLFQSVT